MSMAQRLETPDALGTPPVNATLEQQTRFFAMSSELFLVTDQAGRFLAVNGAWETTLGWTPEELRGRYASRLIHPDDRDAAIAVRRQPDFLRGEPVRFVSRYLTKWGQWRWLEWQADFCLDDGFTYATARDITRRHDVEDMLRSTEARHRLILETLPNAVIAIIDHD
jgi:PAS domain S-box-containing protein